MADLKEETTVDNNNPVDAAQEPRKPIDPSLEGIQLFYEKNKKMVTYVGGGLAVLIAGFLFFKLYYLPEQETEASNEMFWAENYFEKDSFNIALNGGKMVNSADGTKAMQGFEQIAENYAVTKSGNLAHYYAGICNLRLGKFEQAIEHLNQYDGKDDIVAPVAIGAIGDCNMELNRIDEAIKYYTRASDKSNNGFTTPFYLKKAAFAYELKGNFSEAVELYDRIKKEFPRSTEGQEADKEIARLKALGNL